MPFAPGTPKPANSGRRKGNSLKASVAAMLSDLKCNPIEGMARIAEDTKQPAQLRGRMYAELAQYVFPKRRSVELSGPEGGPVETSDVTSAELFESRMVELAARLNPPGSDSADDGQPT